MTWPRQQFGLVFLNCKLTAEPEANKVYLGRPWRPHARTVFIKTAMGAHIRPAGWENWGKASNEATAYYAEYGSTGPGAVTQGRVQWSHQLTAKEARCYTLQAIFSGPVGWEPVRR